MKKYILYLTTFVALGFSACTGDFEEKNTDPTGLDGQAPIEKEFIQPQQSIYLNYANRDYEYQLQQNLNADLYSGYFAVPTAFAGNNNNGHYAMVGGWNNQAYVTVQLNIMKPTAKILEVSILPDYIALAKILRVAGMHRVTDMYGPVSYLNVGEGRLSIPYDSQETVYTTFFAELDDAITKLTQYLDTDLSGVDDLTKNRINTFDLMCRGSYVRWIRFANSLRLRLAMRVVKINPTLAKAQAEKSISHKYGVLTSTDADIEVIDKNLRNPLQVISYSYDDIRIGASFTSILSGLRDPRLEKHVLPVGWFHNKDIIDKNGANLNQIGKYIGIRQGIDIDNKDFYTPYSVINLNQSSPLTEFNPLPIMTVAEVYFLRAEGALRDWNVGGAAKDLYEEGIKVSFNKLGLTASYSAYISNSTNTPAGYVNPREPLHNIAARSTVTVAWNEAATKEQKLEKVITQKWIANFPEGQEAWSEFRRTGYPKLLPVYRNKSNGVVPDGEFLKRLPFTEREYNTNRDEVEKAILFLNGPDNINTRLWWDVNRGNF